MDSQKVIADLTIENKRFTEIIRHFDGGIWWPSNATAQIDVDAIHAQTQHIRIALDEIARLATKITK